jgi:hypothetical protein
MKITVKIKSFLKSILISFLVIIPLVIINHINIGANEGEYDNLYWFQILKYAIAYPLIVFMPDLTASAISNYNSGYFWTVKAKWFRIMKLYGFISGVWIIEGLADLILLHGILPSVILFLLLTLYNLFVCEGYFYKMRNRDRFVMIKCLTAFSLIIVMLRIGWILYHGYTHVKLPHH